MWFYLGVILILSPCSDLSISWNKKLMSSLLLIDSTLNFLNTLDNTAFSSNRAKRWPEWQVLSCITQYKFHQTVISFYFFFFLSLSPEVKILKI